MAKKLNDLTQNDIMTIERVTEPLADMLIAAEQVRIAMEPYANVFVGNECGTVGDVLMEDEFDGCLQKWLMEMLAFVNWLATCGWADE